MKWDKSKIRLLVSVVISVSLHILVLIFLVSDFNWQNQDKNRYSITAKTSEVEEIVEVDVISQSEIDEFYEQKAEKKRQIEEEKRLAAEREKEAKRQQLKQQRRKQKEEQLRLEKARREAALAKQHKLEEAKRKAEEAKRKAEEEQLRLEKARREAALAKQHKLEETKRKAEAEKRKAEEVEQLRLQEERRVQAQQENQRRAIQTSNYKIKIQNDITRDWSPPPSSVKGDKCIIQVKQDRQGNVLKVTISDCQGDSLYKRSVIDAAWKASPLPKAPSPDVFDADLEVDFEQQY